MLTECQIIAPGELEISLLFNKSVLGIVYLRELYDTRAASEGCFKKFTAFVCGNDDAEDRH